MIHIDPKIANHVDAVLAAGFTVYSMPNETGSNRSAGFVAVCLTEDGPFAHIQVPTHNWEPAHLDVPIKPSREYGSGVLVDYDGTPEDAVRALTKACNEPMVAVRFVAKRGEPMPRVPNHGRKCIERWSGAVEFVKLGARGTNWQARTLAGRLEIGDRFEHNGQVLEVQAKRYGGRDYEDVILTPTGGPVVTLSQREFVTLVGAA